MSIVVSTACDTDDKEMGSRKKAEEGKAVHIDYCDECDSDDVTILKDGEPIDQPAPDPVDVEPVDAEPEQDIQAVNAGARPSFALEDPEANLPGWMLSEIQHGNGETGIDLNKNGTQVVAGALGFEVQADCEVSAEGTDYEYCRYRATVTRPDGRTFNAVGDCHIDEQGKSKWDLERQAETRAKKRAVKWAAAGGIEALAE